jgi:hypothetical protein
VPSPGRRNKPRHTGHRPQEHEQKVQNWGWGLHVDSRHPHDFSTVGKGPWDFPSRGSQVQIPSPGEDRELMEWLDSLGYDVQFILILKHPGLPVEDEGGDCPRPCSFHRGLLALS